MQIAIELPNDFVGMQTEQTIAKEMRSAYALVHHPGSATPLLEPVLRPPKHGRSKST
jgi:hypothetical protein